MHQFSGIKFKLDVDNDVNKILSHQYNTSISLSTIINKGGYHLVVGTAVLSRNYNLHVTILPECIVCLHSAV